MIYTLHNPDPNSAQLRLYSALSSPLGAEKALERVRRLLTQGAITPHDLWLLTNDMGEAYAALEVKPYPNQPRWRLGVLRTAPDIPDTAATFLFREVLELSRRGDPLHLVYNDKSARDFGRLPDTLGWKGGDDYGVSYRTDLSGRDDLAPDPAALRSELKTLLSDTFRAFYQPIRTTPPSDTRDFRSVVQAIYDVAKEDDGALYALTLGGAPVAMGIVSVTTVAGERCGGINMLGVLPEQRRRGWGARLHRHLMWEVRQRAPLYLGGTDAANVPMRRLFALNGCREDGREWELEPA